MTTPFAREALQAQLRSKVRNLAWPGAALVVIGSVATAVPIMSSAVSPVRPWANRKAAAGVAPGRRGRAATADLVGGSIRVQRSHAHPVAGASRPRMCEGAGWMQTAAGATPEHWPPGER